jgi:SAM-dependent methyltransferase
MCSSKAVDTDITAPALARDAGAQQARLDRLLPILRCPETGEALVRSGDRLTTVSSGRSWPIRAGRPVLFPGLADPKVMPLEHLSNEVPERALDLIRNTGGLVLNLSAGGTLQKFEHVVEAEAAIFRHTDVVADSHALPFADESFALVIAMNAFEHYRSPERAVAEINRVLKPGGQVLIRTAFLQPLHEAPWHFYNCTRHGLERWFAPFETVDLQVSDNFNPAYSISWIASEAEAALRRDVSPAAAELFRQAPCGRLVDLWRDASRRGEALWTNFFALKQASQEALAAGFEYLGRKPAIAAGGSRPDNE